MRFRRNGEAVAMYTELLRKPVKGVTVRLGTEESGVAGPFDTIAQQQKATLNEYTHEGQPADQVTNKL